MLDQDEHETDTKNRHSTNSSSEITNPLEMVKKTCQTLELLNPDVRDRIRPKLRCWAHMSYNNTKNMTASYSASGLMNPLEMVKKTNSSF